MPQTVPYVHPDTGVELTRVDGGLIDPSTGNLVAPIIDGVPRFVSTAENYAESFGWQWKRWANNQSQTRGASVKQRQLIMDRTHFAEYELTGKTILECGMGGGDDTEVLLTLPFSEIHSFDLSTAVDRASLFLHDDRLVLSQASIYAIPYPDEAFDFVFCHRVLQHTPDPEKALRCISKKVKPGGVLFIHSYKRSVRFMSEWRYKFRPLTTRVPKKVVYLYVEGLGRLMYYLVGYLTKRGGRWADFAYRWIPFYHVTRSGYYAVPEAEAIELAKMITFDALTPKYDFPMTTNELKAILSDEGFTIEHLEDGFESAVYGTARKLEQKLGRPDR